VRAGVRAVLFDLDGTLVDSAPDLAGATNDLRARRCLPPVPYELLRLHGGSGARGMLGAGFGLAPGDPGFAALREEFLQHYATRMLQDTRLFHATLPVLQVLEDAGLRWGIVTNKALHLAEPVARHHGLRPRTPVLVAGDTTPHTKPHPAPLLEAARQLGLPASACIYVGDDHRDMLAGRAAGMRTLAAAWGYLGPNADIGAWGADAVLKEAHELLTWLELA